MPANEILDRKADFVNWMKNQPKRYDPTSKYSAATINQYASKLQNAVSELGIIQYEKLNCFSVDDENVIDDILSYSDRIADYNSKVKNSSLLYGIEFYRTFLFEKNNPNFDYENHFRKCLKKVIESYKLNFDKISQNESYKWECAGLYNRTWDLNVDDFSSMYKTAFSKAESLLNGPQYFPYSMMVELSKDYPDRIKKQFKILFDETKSLEKRYNSFLDEFNKIIDIRRKELGRDNVNHSQDCHAISVYLFNEYPDKYYIYKSDVYEIFYNRMKYKANWERPNTSVSKMESYFEMCDKILNVVKNDDELEFLNRNRAGSDKYDDSSLHLLVFDIIYYASKYLNDDDFYKLTASVKPPLLSKNMWKGILRDDEITTPEILDMLDKMLELKECTIKDLAKSNNKTRSYYDNLAQKFIKNILKKMDYREGIFKDTVGYFDIFCVGRLINRNGKRMKAWTIREELEEALEEMNVISNTQETDVKLNTILYGPPGTGKTYHTVIYAVAIIENKPLKVVQREDYKEVLKRYSRYKEDKLVEFITFHQSFGYEDFIEGIKPRILDDGDDFESDGDILYCIKDGIFKEFCNNRYENNFDLKNFGIRKDAVVWKVSLAGTGDNLIRRYCLNNDCIRIGWDDYGEAITDDTDFSKGGKIPLNAFINNMKKGDIVLTCYSAWEIDAIGVVTGDYEWDGSFDNYNRKRAVDWIVKDIRENIVDINGGTTMTLSSVYKMSRINPSSLVDIIKKYRKDVNFTKTEKKNKVFIIDEINRGNISKILGELITLIEPSKRIGASEEMRAKLPYSNEYFGIPDNLYILGTMNTADRSIAMIDTALRRRFAFKEMMPNPEVLNGVDVEGIIISDMLYNMNGKIEILYDREHTIGHAYFMKLKENPTMDVLADIFKNNIIPLLQEYFYEDYEKIRLVLGDNQKAEEYQFIKEISFDAYALFGNTEIDFEDKKSYVINENAFYEKNSYINI